MIFIYYEGFRITRKSLHRHLLKKHINHLHIGNSDFGSLTVAIFILLSSELINFKGIFILNFY